MGFGPAGVMDLPRPGVYNGHAAWSGREATAGYYNTCIQRGAEEQWDAEQIGAAWRQCPTTEQYSLDLWFVRESEPEGDWDEWVRALLKDRPMHGYEMIQEIGELSGGAWRPSPGSL